MSTRLGTIMLVAAVGTACAAAPRARAFPDLPRYIDPGSTIQLTEASGAKTTGRLESLSPTSLAILADGTRREVPEPQVVRITRPTRRIGRGALLGLGLGVAIGLALPNPKPSGSPFVDTELAGLEFISLGVLGTVVGAVGGAIIKGSRTVYEAPSGRDPGRPVRRPPSEGGQGSSPSRSRSPATR